MSLVLCSKCGKNYSDTLNKCPHCNYQIKVYACSECGFIHGLEDKSCNNCGFVFDNSQPSLPSTEENTLKCANSTYETLGKSENLDELKRAKDVLGLALNQIDVSEKWNEVKSQYESLLDTKNNQIKYELAKRKMEDGELNEAISIFDEIKGFLDSEELENICKARIDEVNSIQKHRKLRIELICSSSILIIAFLFALFKWIIPSSHYSKAMTLFNNHQYEEAYTEFLASGNYKSAKSYADISLKASKYDLALKAYEAKDYQTAIDKFTEAGDYSDAANRVSQTYYDWITFEIDNEDYLTAYDISKRCGVEEDYIYECGKGLIEQGDYDNAYNMFEGVNEYYQKYALGLSCLESGDYEEAVSYLSGVTGIDGANDKYNQAKYYYAGELASNNRYDDSISFYGRTEGYLDSEERIEQVRLSAGIYCIENKRYLDAYDYLLPIKTNGEAKEYYNLAALMKAEDVYDRGRLNEAYDIFCTVTSGTTFEDVSVDDRLSTLENNTALRDICGRWRGTSGTITVEERLSYSSSGWSLDSTKASAVAFKSDMEITCRINDDGSFTIDVKYNIYMFDNYSSFKEYIECSVQSGGGTANVSSIRGNISIGDNATMTVTSDGIVLKYEQVKTPSTYAKEIYTGNYTFGKNIEVW